MTTPLRRSFRFCAGLLAASMTLQEAASAQTSRAVPNNYSCYNTEAVAINDWNNIDINALSQATKSVGGQSLRVPGGDTANYWHWEDYTVLDANGNPALDSNGNQRTADYGPSGSVVSAGGFDSNGNFQYTRPTNQFPFFLPQPLPASLQFQPTTNNATLENIETLVTGAGAEPIWVVNMNTSFLEKELDHLKTARDLGMQVSRIELGNELYFRGGFGDDPGLEQNYVRANQPDNLTPRVGGHPTPLSYAADAKLWADTIKTEFPNAKIAVTGIAGISSPNDPRITNWMADIQTPLGNDGRSAVDAVDAFTIHPYYEAADLGVQLSDAQFAQPQRAGDIARAGISKLRNILNEPQINSSGLQNKELWVTEHNIIETDPVVIGNTWFGALMVDMHGHEFLKDSRTQLSCAHVLTGNAQWQALADASGTVIDPAKRGVDGQPFSDIATAFSQTANGLVLGKSAEVFTEGTATLLHDGDASSAWRVENNNSDKISAVNATDVDELLDLPAGKVWEVLTYTGDPWATVTDEEELDILLEIVTGGSSVSIPAFSKLLATADPNAVEPQAPEGEGAEDPDAEPVDGEEIVVSEEEVDESAEEGSETPEDPIEAAVAEAKAAAAAAKAAEEAKAAAAREAIELAKAEARAAAAEAEAAEPNKAEAAREAIELAKAKAAEARAAEEAEAAAAREAIELAKAEARAAAAGTGSAEEAKAAAAREAIELAKAEAEVAAAEASAAEQAKANAVREAIERAAAEAQGASQSGQRYSTSALKAALSDSVSLASLEVASDAQAKPVDALDVTTLIDAVEADIVEPIVAIAPEEAVVVAASPALVVPEAASQSVLDEVVKETLAPVVLVAIADLPAPNAALTTDPSNVSIPSNISIVEALGNAPANVGFANASDASTLVAPDRDAESVPEPASVLGLGLVAASLAASRYRRKSTKPGFSKVA